MFALIIFLLGSVTISELPVTQQADTTSTLESISKKVAGMEKMDGYLPFFWDASKGKIWLEIDKMETEILYVHGLSRGLGSNDIGLDRGQIGGERIVTFRRIGPRVLLVQPNYDFRAIGDNEEEKRAVEESFAASVLWGFEVAAEEDGRVLVDATPFFLRDVHGVIGRLKASSQGTYKLEAGRSAINLDRTKNFPKNTEVDAILTFTGEPAGSYVKSVTPTPNAVTVNQHHSFIELPDDAYEARAFDPRAGYFGISYMDYATPISEPIRKRFISRHRLEKVDPDAAVSKAKDPIVYYVDSGAPEPIRSALIEGASWWNQAFEAAGYEDAFRVEVLPDGADPMDVRYNVIQWVHRSTRGWSYGNSVGDPRTGEIIKGHVSLGSLRVRQDFLIAEGLLAPYEDGTTVPPEMEQMALARLRQLSVHEIGHTLGLSHNYAASAFGRASVMDYPHPYVTFDEDGLIDLSDAYATGVGAFDKVSIAYGYQDFPEGTDESEALDNILSRSFEDGLIFISDTDARATGGAHPLAHLWDNGTDAVKELERVLEIRKRALDRFSENNIRNGQPFASLENVLVPVYLFHRYQLEAASKLVGGLYYTYALRGDGQQISKIVSPDRQRDAIEGLLATLDPEVLALPEDLLRIIPPQPTGYGRDRENFVSHTGLTFDPMAAAESAAGMTLGFLLHPQRMARLVQYHARDDKNPGMVEVVDRLIDRTWKSEPTSAIHAEIQRAVDILVLNRLMSLVSTPGISAQVQAIAFSKVIELRDWLESKHGTLEDAGYRAHVLHAINRIKRFEKDPSEFVVPPPIRLPAGSPIGMGAGEVGCSGCWWNRIFNR